MRQRALLAITLLLCLTIAPLCGARCSMQLCLPSSSSAAGNSGGCHESSDQPIDSGWKTIALRACAPAELVFTSPRGIDHLSSQKFSSLFLPVPSSSREATAALNSNTSPDIAESIPSAAANTPLRL